jgi:hypothetical protein
VRITVTKFAGTALSWTTKGTLKIVPDLAFVLRQPCKGEGEASCQPQLLSPRLAKPASCS